MKLAEKERQKRGEKGGGGVVRKLGYMILELKIIQ